MKNARLQKTESSARDGHDFIDASANFPIKKNSVVAEVLSQLLKGEQLTSLDSVRGASTTRLAASIHYLKTTYNWLIESVDVACSTVDGRVSTVAKYYLRHSQISAAHGLGASDFLESVEVARAKQKIKKGESAKVAKRRNAMAKKRFFDATQMELRV